MNMPSMSAPQITPTPEQMQELVDMRRWVLDASVEVGENNEEFERAITEMADSFARVLPMKYLTAFIMKDLLISICAWHEGGQEVTKILKAEGDEVTHGICKSPECRAKFKSN